MPTTPERLPNQAIAVDMITSDKIFNHEFQELCSYSPKRILSEKIPRSIQTRQAVSFTASCGFVGGIFGENMFMSIDGLSSNPSSFGFTETKSWSYHYGNCRKCKSEYTLVSLCNICQKCEKL